MNIMDNNDGKKTRRKRCDKGKHWDKVTESCVDKAVLENQKKGTPKSDLLLKEAPPLDDKNIKPKRKYTRKKKPVPPVPVTADENIQEEKQVETVAPEPTAIAIANPVKPKRTYTRKKKPVPVVADENIQENKQVEIVATEPIANPIKPKRKYVRKVQKMNDKKILQEEKDENEDKEVNKEGNEKGTSWFSNLLPTGLLSAFSTSKTPPPDEKIVSKSKSKVPSNKKQDDDKDTDNTVIDLTEEIEGEKQSPQKGEEDEAESSSLLEQNEAELMEYNTIVKETESLKQEEFTTESTTNDFLYPNLNDPNFNLKIAAKKEFQEHRYDAIDPNIDFLQKVKEECESEFEIMPHQQFVRNFMSMDTPYNCLLLYHQLGTGKCHAKDTPIMMYDGSIKLVQDIKVNDLLMGDDSRQRTVTSLARGRDKMYNIIPVKGEKYTVNEEHILCLKASGFPKLCHNHNHNNFNIQWLENNEFQSRTFAYHKNNEESKEKMEHCANLFYDEIKKNPNTSDNVFEISVNDYLQLCKTKRSFLKGYKVPIHFEEKEIPMDPYMIGFWLGDRSKRDAIISSQDSTVLKFFEEKLKEYNLELIFRSGYEYGISGNGKVRNNPFLNTLKDLNMIHNKHIPKIYKCNSRENRLKLLAGFIDSDGHFNKRVGGFEFTQTNETLMDDVVYLARSLGFSCYKKAKKTSWTYKGIQHYGHSYRIHINGEGIDEIPTLIPRNRSVPIKQIQDVLVTGIKVEYVNEDDYFGFTLDGNCRYLMGDFTVTHNTCSAIGIAEEMRSYMKQTGQTKKIMVIASPNVQDNFKSQLFNANKLELKNNKWNLNTCIGNTLLKEINPNNIEGMTKEYVQSRIQSLIKKYYTFTGYDAVVSYTVSDKLREINKNKRKIGPKDDKNDDIQDETTMEIIDLEPIHKDDTDEIKRKKEETIKRFRKLFDNRLIIVDEVQNMLSRSDKEEYKQCAKILKQIVRFCKYTRFIFLSATPVYNSYDEIIWLVNIMNMNDKRPIIKKSQVFDTNGEFVKEVKNEKDEVIVEDGRELLKRKLIGYVSYVRGENPYTFPFRIYPETFADAENLLTIEKYPTKLLNGVDMIEEDKPKMNVLKNVFVNTLEKEQSILYNIVIQEATKNNKMDKTTFGFKELIKPINILNMSYPFMDMDTENPELKYTDDINLLHGKDGLQNCMDYNKSDEGDKSKLHDFYYKKWVLEQHGPIFKKEKIRLFSKKIHAICEAIEKSTGIVLIYSRYIEGGLIPMALALEEMGINRYCSNDHVTNFMNSKRTNAPSKLDALTMKPVNASSKYSAKYAMITGTTIISPSNTKDLELICHSSNFDGKHVKVVLISEAGSEGIDFKCVRQVHVMDPWYNMSRIEQIIGRAVRNKSHCGLPFEQRNVEIYMHCASDPNTKDMETADMYMYRLAEQKAIQIGKITRLLKETAVDCILNSDQQKFTESNMNTEVNITLSTGKIVNFKIGDKKYSSACDYMESCEYTCSPASIENKNENKNTEVDESTYQISHLTRRRDNIAKRIRQLFRDKVYYKKADLMREIKVRKPYKDQEIYYVLGQFIKNKEWVVFNRSSGYLVRHDDSYSFQPQEIVNEHASMYERMIPIDFKPHHIEKEIDNYIPSLSPSLSPPTESPIESQSTDENTQSSSLSSSPSPKPMIKPNPPPQPKPVNTTKIELSTVRKPNTQTTTTNYKQFRRNNKDDNIKLSDMVEQTVRKNENKKNLSKKDELHHVQFSDIKKEIEDVLQDINNDNNTEYVENKKNTLKEYGKVVRQIWVEDFHFTLSSLLQYTVEHLLDTMSFSQKLICVQHLFQTRQDVKPRKKDDTVENMISKYFFKRMMIHENKVAMFITKESENKLYLLDETKGWVDGVNKITDMELFTKSNGTSKSKVYETFWKAEPILYKTKREIANSKNNNSGMALESIMGFVYYDTSKKLYEVKLKNMLKTRLGKQSGARCADMDINKILLPRMNSLLSYLKITIQNKNYQKQLYCFLYEMLLRHASSVSESGKDQKEIWFLSPEESIYTDIQNLAIDSSSGDWVQKTKDIINKKS